MRAADQFHVGIVVEDLDASLEQLSILFGYEWGAEMRTETQVELPDGEMMVEVRFRYSRDTPRVELIQARPGTLWTPVANSGIHHLGYWSDDVAADGAELEQAGYAFEAAGSDGRGARLWTYHRSERGPRIELLSRALEPLLSPLWEAPAP